LDQFKILRKLIIPESALEGDQLPEQVNVISRNVALNNLGQESQIAQINVVRQYKIRRILLEQTFNN
jgi:hypothetical protein